MSALIFLTFECTRPSGDILATIVSNSHLWKRPIAREMAIFRSHVGPHFLILDILKYMEVYERIWGYIWGYPPSLSLLSLLSTLALSLSLSPSLLFPPPPSVSLCLHSRRLWRLGTRPDGLADGGASGQPKLAGVLATHDFWQFWFRSICLSYKPCVLTDMGRRSMKFEISAKHKCIIG